MQRLVSNGGRRRPVSPFDVMRMRTLSVMLGVVVGLAACGLAERRYELSLAPAAFDGDRLTFVLIDRSGLVTNVRPSIRADAVGLTNPRARPDVLRFMWYSTPCDVRAELRIDRETADFAVIQKACGLKSRRGVLIRRSVEIRLSGPLSVGALAFEGPLVTPFPQRQTNEQWQHT